MHALNDITLRAQDDAASLSPLQARYPTLQPAGAFLKQASRASGYTSATALYEKESASGMASDPTSPTSVSATSSFLASIRHGLEELVDGEEDSDDEDDEDDEGSSPRYYSSSSNNTYYSPPSSFSQHAQASAVANSFLLTSDAVLSMDPLFARNARIPAKAKSDDDMIFDMEM